MEDAAEDVLKFPGDDINVADDSMGDLEAPHQLDIAPEVEPEIPDNRRSPEIEAQDSQENGDASPDAPLKLTSLLHLDEDKPRLTRSEAAKLFFEVLVLKTRNTIDVEQRNPFGDIMIRAM
ncbi:hypothetical protein BC829DRAFT_391448 [Chytridium lagenaria]|nr:hypothetical protein BC829DRAFT_391448 [Chytridium lagenaria]